ncbi:MAG TPA: YhbY family RNA-binding protein [Oscillospiraceae bacterium]|nr:YhbY family RNA-binding protein [Oscillospiraceae bacterium]
MTSKERAALRAKANPLEVLFQIGKNGVTDAVIAQTEAAFSTKELIKIRALPDSSPITARKAADILADKTKADVIQVIGAVIVLYRENKELQKNEKEAERRKKQAFYAENSRNKKTFSKSKMVYKKKNRAGKPALSSQSKTKSQKRAISKNKER